MSQGVWRLGGPTTLARPRAGCTVSGKKFPAAVTTGPTASVTASTTFAAVYVLEFVFEIRHDLYPGNHLFLLAHKFHLLS